MKLYIVERSNPHNRPNPEVFLNGAVAKEAVKREMDAVFTALGRETCWENVFRYWYFESEHDYERSAIIDELEGDISHEWYWRITSHEVEGV